MDYATSLSEAQQQLLAQYQQHLQQQQQQQQQQQPQQQQPQQQPQQASQAYDPTQFQSYDPASQAYYPYHQAYQTPVAHHQHPQQYPYYTPDYGASATAASNAYQADAASQAQDPSAAAQQYYPQDQQAAYNASLNPAAAAAVHALSQLTQFAGTMDAAERAVAEQQWSNGGAGQVPPQQAQVQHAGMVHPHAFGKSHKECC